MNKEELLYNEIYERTKDFGRTQFVREIMRLQRENKELQVKVNELETKINTYENPEDMTLMFMWCNEKAKDKIKELKQKVNQLETNIEEAIRYIKSNPNVFYDEYLIDVETLLNNECTDEVVGEIRFISKLLSILERGKE